MNFQLERFETAKVAFLSVVATVCWKVFSSGTVISVSENVVFETAAMDYTGAALLVGATGAVLVGDSHGWPGPGKARRGGKS